VRKTLSLTIAACLVLMSGAAYGLTQTTPFTVQMTITASCVIASASTLNFGSSQGVITSAVNATSTIQVQCTNTTPYNIGLNAGTATAPLATVTNEPFVVGYDGRAYVKGLRATNSIVVGDGGSECRASFPFTPKKNSQVVIGPVVCQ
jgi:outer membrane usher protein FimD/PapC